jgi:hypothetical protein
MLKGAEMVMVGVRVLAGLRAVLVEADSSQTEDMHGKQMEDPMGLLLLKRVNQHRDAKQGSVEVGAGIMGM